MASEDGEYIIPLGPYRLQFEELGKGSFGIVYKGIDTKDGSEVAAKKIKYKEQGEEINEVLSKMGNNELEIFRKLQDHDNIVKLLDYQNDGKSHWFIMEFCELGDLPQYLKSKPVNLDTKIKILAECASAISFMHSFHPPIVHRDIKPTNILMKREGKQDAAKITDFGIGKLYNDPNQGPLNLTMTTAGGTQSFQAPEFFETDGGYLRYKPGIDTFSLGLLFHVILMFKDHHRDMTPISVNSRELGQNIHYGFEVVNAKKLNQPIPPLLCINESDLPSVKILKKLITQMTAYSVQDRKSLSDVKGSVMELYCKHLQKQVTDVSDRANNLESAILDKDKVVIHLSEELSKVKQQLELSERHKSIAFQQLSGKENELAGLKEDLSTANQNLQLAQNDKYMTMERLHHREMELELLNKKLVSFKSNDSYLNENWINALDQLSQKEQELVNLRGEISTITKLTEQPSCLAQGAVAEIPVKKKPSCQVKDTKFNCIEVTGLRPNIPRDFVYLFFESKKSGGGEIEEMNFDEETGAVIITFKDEETTKSVLQKHSSSPLSISGAQLQICLFDTSLYYGSLPGLASCAIDLTDAVAELTVKKKTSYQVKDTKLNCIEVTGLRPNIPRDFVYLFFESKKSGGGEIEEMSFDEETGAVIITFKDEETTKSVLQKHSSSPLSISGAQLQICLFDTSLYGGSLPGLASCAIDVTGLPVNATVDMITMFFDNRRMSGGSTVEEVALTAVDGNAIITFETSDVAQRVLDKHKAKPLKYEENQLQIYLLSSQSRPSQIPGPTEANTLFLKNLPEDADTEDICCYLERVGNCKFQECIFGITAGTALVRCVFMPGYDKFYELSCRKPLKGCMIDIQCVPISRTIEVFGAGNASEQLLMMYFEHPKSKGGEVEEVNIVPEHGCAIITFKTHRVAEQVLSHPSHMLTGKQLKLNLHHECLGVIPPDHDYTNPTAGIPSHITVTQFNKDIVAFILNTQSNWTYIEDEMRKIYGEVHWPCKSSSSQDITIKCTLQRSTVDIQRKVSTWSDDVKASFDGLLSQYAIDYVDTLKDAWNDLYNYCKEIKPKDPANAFLTIDKTNCSVTIIGRRKVVHQLMESLTKAKHDIRGRLSRQAQVITEPVTHLKSLQVYFLVAHKFPQHMKQTFVDMKVETDIKNANVSFIGVPNDIITAKLQMYELVNQMVGEKIEICKPIGILLRHKIIQDYLLYKYREANVVVVYDAIDTELTVYSKSKEDLETGLAIIKRTVIERSITLQEDSRVPLRSQHWTSLKEDMLKDYDGELIISVLEDFSNIQVVASARIMDGVLETIANYLKDNTILKKIIKMESGTFKLMSKFLKTDLDTIEKELSHSSVNIWPSRNSSKPGFHVEGTQHGVPQAVAKVKDLTKNIVYREHEIDKHRMPKCFHEESGRSYLHSLESTYKVAIELEKDKMHESDGDSQNGKSGGPVVKGKVILYGGQELCVADGDLTTYQVDAIVNADNAELKHYGGLARAILSKELCEIKKMTDPNDVVVWEWFNEYHRWRPYSPSVSNYIQQKHDEHPSKLIDLGKADRSMNMYNIDFNSTCQIRMSTGVKHPIQQKIYPYSGSLGSGVVWKWEGDGGIYQEYDFETSEILENEFKKVSTTKQYTLDLQNMACLLPYIIDFQNMTQTRVHTHRLRDIRREKMARPYIKRKDCKNVLSMTKSEGTKSDTIQAVRRYFSSGKTSDKGGRNKYAGSTRNTRQAHTSTAYGDVHPSQMVFHIYGLSQADIDQVAKTIDSYCDDESNDRVLDSRKDQETISKLSEKQVSFIEGLERKHHVKITINRGARVNRIRIQGQNRATNTVVEEIWKIFRDVDSEERDKTEADLISKQVHWQFEHQGTFAAYPPDINLRIEKAYQNKAPHADWKEIDIKGHGLKQLRLIFANNMETELSTPGYNVPVRRFTQDSVELPSPWTTMQPGDIYIMIDLNPTSTEYTTVQQKFTKDLQRTVLNSIIKIQRLQNPSMYKKYMVHKTHMDAANPSHITNEKILWHGTSADTLDEINTSGFNRSFCGKNGTAHGKGVYFATYASLSAGYARPDVKGHHHMYMCKVLVGECCQSNPSYLVPPPKDPQKPSIKFDSVVDNMSAPKIIVIFTDTQSYPEYLITYT